MSLARSARGFSLVEVIVAIVLVGIIASISIARLLRGNTFDPAIVQSQTIGMARSAQQRAIGRADVSLLLTRSGNQLSLAVRESGSTIQRSDVPVRDVLVSGDADNQDSCSLSGGAHTVTATDSLILEFDSLGDLRRAGLAGSPDDVDTAARICVNNDPRYSLCISKVGFAYAGDCENGS